MKREDNKHVGPKPPVVLTFNIVLPDVAEDEDHHPYFYRVDVSVEQSEGEMEEHIKQGVKPSKESRAIELIREGLNRSQINAHLTREYGRGLKSSTFTKLKESVKNEKVLGTAEGTAK